MWPGAAPGLDEPCRWHIHAQITNLRIVLLRPDKPGLPKVPPVSLKKSSALARPEAASLLQVESVSGTFRGDGETGMTRLGRLDVLLIIATAAHSIMHEREGDSVVSKQA